MYSCGRLLEREEGSLCFPSLFSLPFNMSPETLTYCMTSALKVLCLVEEEDLGTGILDVTASIKEPLFYF